LFEFKKGENCNRKNTFEDFEDYNLSLTPKSGKLAICGWALIKILDSHNNDQSKKQGHPVSTHQDAPCQHSRNPILKVFDPPKLFLHGPSVIFFDFKTHSATFIMIFDFRREGW